MISEKENPVAWALMLYELQDACEHLQKLVDEMAAAGSIDEIEFKIQLGHVYSHLNVAWNSRNDGRAESFSDDREQRMHFPDDIDPT